MTKNVIRNKHETKEQGFESPHVQISNTHKNCIILDADYLHYKFKILWKMRLG